MNDVFLSGSTVIIVNILGKKKVYPVKDVLEIDYLIQRYAYIAIKNNGNYYFLLPGKSLFQVINMRNRASDLNKVRELLSNPSKRLENY